MATFASVLWGRLQRSWFGSIIALAGVTLLLAVPLVRRCSAVSGVRGVPSGDGCAWTSPVQGAEGLGLVMLLAVVAVAAILAVVFPRPWALIAVGLGDCRDLAGHCQSEL